MKYFPEIIRILDRFREPRAQTVDRAFKSRKEDKAYQLYEGIRSGTFGDDSIASKTLYGGTSDDNRYTTLKNRLKVRLLNSLFHLNLKRAGFSESAQARYTIKRRAFIVETLAMLGARNAAMRLAERTLSLARHYQQLDVVIAMSFQLRVHASIIGKPRSYDDYDAILKQAIDSFRTECISWEYFDRAQTILSRKAGGRTQYALQFRQYIDELRLMLNDASSFTFRLNYYRLLTIYLSISGSHEERIAACDEALAYLRSLPHLTQKPRLGEFSLQKLESYMAAKDYAMARSTAEGIPSLFGLGSNNWFSFTQTFFLLHMNTLDFGAARDLYRKVTEHPRFALQPELARERWTIFEFYLQYALGRTQASERSEFHTHFEHRKVLGMVPVAAKDKHGLNVALLIGQVLYLLGTGDFHGIDDRIEALTIYRVRYLRVTDNPQSHLFFKLLRVMENSSFDYETAVRNGDKFYRELKVIRPERVHLEEELQIIPYTWLWEQILEKLREIKQQNRR